MARVTKGYQDGISGKVGPVVFFIWKGGKYARSLNAKRKGPDSPAQLAQQQRLTVATLFLRSMTPLLNEGFGHLAVSKSPTNVASSYTTKNALTGVYPDITISYPNVLISQGDMHNVLNPSATLTTEGTLLFSWTDNSGIGAAKGTDRILVAAYCPEINQAIYTAGHATRSALSTSLDLASFSGTQVHVYIGLVSENRKNVASSLYLGEFEVQ